MARQRAKLGSGNIPYHGMTSCSVYKWELARGQEFSIFRSFQLFLFFREFKPFHELSLLGGEFCKIREICKFHVP